MAACSSSPREWLTLPYDLNDSFADDLIRQFDNKRTDLHKGQQPSSSISDAPPPPPIPPPKSPILPQPESSTSRRSSASDLWRRPWSFLKPSSSRSFHKHEKLPPTTIARHTTITLPLTKKPSAPSCPPPPVISHYPPKPLQYAPVDVPPPRKTLIHRISMPALRRTTDEEGNVSHHRRKSDGPLFRKKKASQS